MKKSNLIKVFSILVMSVMVMMFSTNVFAADSGNVTDLTGELTRNTGSGNTNTGNSAGGTNTNGTNTNGTNTNGTSNSNRSNNANTNGTTNGSIYNNNNLPKTGIEDSIPVTMLVVVFGISAVYAYRKIKEYRNI